MKKGLLIALACTILLSCATSDAPQPIAEEFIKAAYNGDAATAASMATEKTKSIINQNKKETPGVPAEESFSLSTLKETVNGNSAEVKNDFIKLSMEKEGGEWKVVATPELMTSIANRQQDLAALKQKWEALLKEYDGRMNVAREYIQYKKNQGSTSEQLKTAEEMLGTLSTKTTWDKEKILMYAQKQKQFQALIDKALEPSQNAGSDMSMNYFLQVSNADSRIKSAEAEYQTLAEKTASTTYPALITKELSSSK